MPCIKQRRRISTGHTNYINTLPADGRPHAVDIVTGVFSEEQTMSRLRARPWSGRREADNVSDVERSQNIYIHRRRTRSRAADRSLTEFRRRSTMIRAVVVELCMRYRVT